MAITFNNIPNTIRTPQVYLEVDNSRALKGLLANPYKVLVLGEKVSSGNGLTDTLYEISSNGLANGYFGAGSILARMCNIFKVLNPNTELYAIALSTPAGAVAASATLHFSVALSGAAGGSLSGTEPFYLMINGKGITETLYSGWSTKDINSAIQSTISGDTAFAVKASTTATSALNLIAVNAGLIGNYMDVRANFYAGQSYPKGFTNSVVISAFSGGTLVPSLDDAWAVIDGVKFQHMAIPYANQSNLTLLKTEMTNRFGPLVDMWGHAFVGLRGTLASCGTLGNANNTPHITILGAYDSPTPPEEWAAAVTAVAAKYLNDDPGRPLQFLSLGASIIAPPLSSRFTRAERDTLLYDGIATWICDTVGTVLLERCITTYKTNALGLADYSYLDIETLATLDEIRYQYKTHMQNRYLIPRYKLAGDDFTVPPGAFIVTPKTIRQETIALFSTLQEKGLIEDIENFIKNLVVERDGTDMNRVNVLLPPDLINQFRILAGVIQFIV